MLVSGVGGTRGPCGASLFIDLRNFDRTDHRSPRNTPEWDSLAGMNFVLALEAEFRVKLTRKEINSMRSVAIVRKVLTSKGVFDG